MSEIQKNADSFWSKLIFQIVSSSLLQERDYLQAAENWLYDHAELPRVPPETIAPIFKQLLEEQLIEEFIRNPETYFKPDTESSIINAIEEYLSDEPALDARTARLLQIERVYSFLNVCFILFETFDSIYLKIYYLFLT